MVIDNKIHDVFDFLSGHDIRWHDFAEVGVVEHWAHYYYAEDRLYILRDVMTDCMYFVEAGSPAEALRKYKDIVNEAMHAGEWVQEDVE